MISYVVATHDTAILDGGLGATLRLDGRDELVVVRDAPSIAAAYDEGQARSTQPVRCYVHHDVRILDPRTLRRELVRECAPGVGIVGVIGARELTVPWWEARGEALLGSVVDGRLGLLHFGAGGDCAVLDGLLLATSQTVTWDQGYSGWHLYDHDACAQMLALGLRNRCLDGGGRLLRHDTRGPASTAELDGWKEGLARFRRKWGPTTARD